MGFGNLWGVARWRGGAVWAEIFFATVAEPDAKDLGDLIFLGFGEGLVEGESAEAFGAAGEIAVGVPSGSGEADEAGDFFDEWWTGERDWGFFGWRHGVAGREAGWMRVWLGR